MTLSRLDIQDFRNLATARLDFSPRCNLITGENAAGKTSLLEAIHVLARLRSFRTQRLESLIREGCEAFQLVARLEESGRTLPVGLRRGRKELDIRLGGAPVRRVSDLAAHFPLVVITADLHRVLEEGPKYRRQFLDWGLFHVEPEFHATWRQYAQALKQRNACLRQGVAEAQVRIWDAPLLASGGRIHEMRRTYIKELEPLFAHQAERILGLAHLSLRYAPGWAQRLDYPAALAEALVRDREQGQTRVGPHRADLQFLKEDQDVRERLSRGQQKQLLIALLLAQAELLFRRRDRICQFLVDDLPAELDAKHQARVLAQLRELGSQVFITAIDAGTLDLRDWPEPARFHVEHGVVREVV
jgi:DNA replication and repair protein RecF